MLFLCAAAALSSCDYFFPQEDGRLMVFFSRDSYLATKATEDVPDTNSFLLSVTASNGVTVYEGLYGSAPQPIMASPGTYNVKVYSSNMDIPAYSNPVYGDEQTVLVESGKESVTRLFCQQVNSGVIIKFDPDLINQQATVNITAGEWQLIYPAGETRTAYFPPCLVHFDLCMRQQTIPLLDRTLRAREILSLNVHAPSVTAGGVSVSIDTSRIWTSEDVTPGSSGGQTGSDISNALDVLAARQSPGTNDVWVYGYIVGGDLSSSKASYRPPFTSRTNILLSSKAVASSREGCLSVQLQQGDIRDALNLVDNPGLLGRQVFLKGNLVPSYYGLPGLQGLSDYAFGSQP